MPTDVLHWAFLALVILALVVGGFVWWMDRDRTYSEDDLKCIEFADHLEALKDARRVAR